MTWQSLVLWLGVGYAGLVILALFLVFLIFRRNKF